MCLGASTQICHSIFQRCALRCRSYTIGKERLFLEAARVLQRKVYVSATKRKVGIAAVQPH